jgi:hypothetical protein
MCRRLKHLTLNDAPPAAQPCDVMLKWQIWLQNSLMW